MDANDIKTTRVVFVINVGEQQQWSTGYWGWAYRVYPTSTTTPNCVPLPQSGGGTTLK